MTTNTDTDDVAPLYMDDETTPGDVLRFAASRLRKPYVLDDVVAFNFHSQPMDEAAFREWAGSAQAGVYAVPYQVPGVWAYMIEALPSDVAHADLLAYQQGNARYVDYPNWRRVWKRSGEQFDDLDDFTDGLGSMHQAILAICANDDVDLAGGMSTPTDPPDRFTITPAAEVDAVSTENGYVVEDDARSWITFDNYESAVVYVAVATGVIDSDV